MFQTVIRGAPVLPVSVYKQNKLQLQIFPLALKDNFAVFPSAPQMKMLLIIITRPTYFSSWQLR